MAAPGPSSALNCSQNLRRDRFCFSQRLANLEGAPRERRQPDRSGHGEEFIIDLDRTPAEVSVWWLASSVALSPADADGSDNGTDEIRFDLLVFANAKLV